MERKKTRLTRKGPVFLFLLMVIIDVNFLLQGYSKSNNFTNNLELGTQILKVSYYNEQEWNNSVNSLTNPRDLFGGQADIIGAKYKVTITENNYIGNESTHSLFLKFVFPEKVHDLFPNISQYGYDYYLINNYTNQYKVWGYIFYYWNFTTGEFNVFQDYKYYSKLRMFSFIIQNPIAFGKLLVDYNDFAGKINNDSNLHSLNISFPILTGDDLMWQFLIDLLAVGTPVNDYLIDMINVLNCTNAEVQGNTITFQRRGEQDFNVEVTYNQLGRMGKFVIKNIENQKIYEIISFYPKNLVYLIIGMIFLSLLGIVILIFLKRRKRLKT
ncbi:hypothetical protein LCGC14_0736610 [marine sediment metagenome]|uniref:Uncharacterized protein n=1 Tax=marine sediment metagenome TaxID=412755 RepID=A0A0F9TF70_9ZZZZ|nr:hypothetical protein [archaeon]HEC38069.1 hypothetical protein [bacterium]